MSGVQDKTVFSAQEWDELMKALLLSPRQIEIAQRVLEGQSDKQIAIDLRMAVATVRTHLGRLFTRLDVRNRNELILLLIWQFRNGCREADCER